MATRLITPVLLLLWAALRASAQVVTTSPEIVTTDSAPIVITFHAGEGSRGLAGLGPSAAVYAHTGVILAGESGWQKAPQWLDNAPRYRLAYAAPDTWTLTIPSIAEYYGLTPEQTARVEQLMFVFRNADGSREGKTASGGDIAVNVSRPGFSWRVETISGRTVFEPGEKAGLRVAVSEPCPLSIAIIDSMGEGKTVSQDTPATTLVTECALDTPGAYSVVAKAVTAPGDTAVKTLDLLCIAPTSTAAYPDGEVRQGAVIASDGASATFAIAAPGKKNVILLGSWNDFKPVAAQQMQRAAESVELPADTSYIKNAWSLRQPFLWTTVNGLEPGREYTYYYLVDCATAVADPYSRLVLDPASDRFISSTVFPDMPEYPDGKVPDGTILSVLSTTKAKAPARLEKIPDAHNLTVYELLIRDFTGDGTGNGTIEGVIDRLDYIKDMGFNAVELMPVMEFGGNNSWGYNPLFYFAPDKAYGTPDDYRRLVEEIHSRGMAVIFDVVMNHADTRNPWQLMYEPSQNPFFNATPPHSYNAFHDWNQDNPIVFRQWVDVLRYWAEEFAADGFRFDMVKGMGDQGSYSIAYDRATNSFATPSEATTNRYNASRVERMGRLKAALDDVLPGAIFICEDLATAQEDTGLAGFGAMDWANVNNAACQWAMGWSDGADLSRFYAPRDGGRPFGSTVSYAESHDEQRCAYKQQQWGVAAVKASEEQQMRRLGSIAAMMLMAPGAHMVWQFEELGDAQNVKQPDNDNDTSPRKSAWPLLDNPLHRALRDTYSALIRLRNDNPDLFGESTEVSAAATPSSWQTGYTLSLAAPTGKRLFVAANPLPDRQLAIALPSGENFSVALSSAGIETPSVADDGTVTLAPGAFAVMVNEAVAAGIGIATPDNISPAPAVYDLAGRRITNCAAPRPGIYISVDRHGKAIKHFVH